MNPEHVEIVKQGAPAIEEYRKENPDVVLDLSGAILTGADLAAAPLFNANLSMASLNGANLHLANLTDAKLNDANLDGAILNNAILCDANLNDAYLTAVKLENTTLHRAKFKRAYLNHADFNFPLGGADVSNAILDGTAFVNVDLQEFRGLESVVHSGPSSIGIDSFYRSNGDIPEIFLRGCGVPEKFITYASSLVENAFDFYSCFISYSHEDKAFARRLHDTLQGEGIRCWLDEKEMRMGDDIHHEVDRGIRLYDKVVLCASESSLTSGWVDSEVSKALAKERRLMKERQGEKVLALIPLDLDGYLFSDEFQRGWKDIIHERLAGDFTDWKTDSDKFNAQVQELVKALRTDGGRGPDPVPKL